MIVKFSYFIIQILTTTFIPIIDLNNNRFFGLIQRPFPPWIYLVSCVCFRITIPITSLFPSMARSAPKSPCWWLGGRISSSGIWRWWDYYGIWMRFKNYLVVWFFSSSLLSSSSPSFSLFLVPFVLLLWAALLFSSSLLSFFRLYYCLLLLQLEFLQFNFLFNYWPIHSNPYEWIHCYLLLCTNVHLYPWPKLFCFA